MVANTFLELLSSNLAPDALVQQGLRLLEDEFRKRALLALADWERTGLPAAAGAAAPELFAAIAALQRPSWGNWNGLLTALRKARAAVLNKGDKEMRRRLEGATQMARVLDRLDEPVEPAVVRGLQPLSQLVRSPLASQPRLGQVLALPIALRNRVAHDMPDDPAWWQKAAQALRPLLGLHVRPEPGPKDNATAIPLPAPWFLGANGQLWSFNGIEKDFTPVYVSPLGKTRHDGSRSPELLLAFQRLLGKTGVQDRDFKALLARLAPEDVKGVLFGDYLLGRPVGEGGFATVHLGRQLSTGRKVAIKVLRDGFGEEQRRRFHQEAAFLARLDHPHVVKVHGRGEEMWSPPRHVPLAGEEWYERFSRSSPLKSYIALEWVDGKTLEAVYQGGAAGRPGVRVLTDWFAQAAEALAAVHAEGLIHRDVKPGNLMATEDGRVKLMDFGIARTGDEDRTLHTMIGALLGTPAYMAPEQFEAGGDKVTPAADVYALCATFYELFTGTRLFRHDLQSPEAIWDCKRDGTRPESPRVLAPGLPWEIETLLLGGMEREAKDRPQSAADLAADLRRVLANEPIHYKRPPWRRRAQLFYRRHRSLVHWATLAAAALMIAVVGAGSKIVEALGRTEAEEKRGKREKQKQTLAKERAKTEKEKKKKSDRQKIYEEYVATLQEAPALFADAKIDALRDRLSKYRRPGKDDPRGFEWHYWWRVCHAELRTLRPKSGPCWSVAFDAEGKRLFGLSRLGPMTVWDAADGRELFTLPGRVACLAFSPDKKLLATSSGRAVHLGETATIKHVRMLGESLGIEGLAFSPDGSLVVAGDMGANLHVWNVASGKYLINLSHNLRSTRQANIDPTRSLDKQGGQVFAVAFHPDGKLLASGAEDGTVHLWLVPQGRLVGRFKGHTGPVTSVAFSPDKKWLASASLGTKDTFNLVQKPGEILVRSMMTGEVALTLKRHTDYLPWAGSSAVIKSRGRTGDFGASFTSDSKYLVSTADRIAKIWEVPSGREVNNLKGHSGHVLSAAVSPDGKRVATAGEDETVKIWDTRTRQDVMPFFQHGNGVRGVAVSADGRRVAAVCQARTKGERRFEIRQFDVRTGKELRKLGPYHGYAGRVAYAAGGKMLSAGRAWDAQTGEPCPLPKSPCTSTLAPDGKTAALGGPDGVQLWDLKEKRVVRTFAGEREKSLAPVFSADGTLVADSNQNGDITIWVISDGKKKCRLQGHAAKVRAIAFSPDGKTLASGGDDRVVRVWNVATGQVLYPLRGHNREVTGVAFSPNGRRLVSTSGDVAEGRKRPGEVKLWELTVGRECLTLPGDGKCLFGGAAFSPDGRRLFAAATRLDEKSGERPSGAILVWDARPPVPDKTRDPEANPATEGKKPPVVDVAGLTSRITNIFFHPRGDRLAVSTAEGEIAMVNTTTGRISSRLESHTGSQTTGLAFSGLAFSSDGTQLLSMRPFWNEVMIWSLRIGKEGKRLNRFPGTRALSAGFSPEGTRLLVASAKLVATEDARVSAFDLSADEAEPDGFALRGHRHQLAHAVFSSDGKYLATLSASPGQAPTYEIQPQELKIWETRSGRALHTITGLRLPLWGLSFSADGRRLAAALGSRDRERNIVRIQAVKIWDVKTGREAHSLDRLQGLVLPFALSPDGKHFAGAAEESYAIRLIEATTGKTQRTLPGTANVVTALAFSRDGKQLASANTGDTVQLWNLTCDNYPGRVPSPRLRGPRGTFYAPEQPRLAPMIEASAGAISTFDSRTKAVPHAVLSPDGKRLAGWSQGRSIHAWDVATRRQVFRVLDDSLTPLAFSYGPKGKHLHLIAQRVEQDTNPGTRSRLNMELTTWDAKTGKTVRSPLRLPAFSEAKFARGGHRFAARVGANKGPGPATIQVWDVEKGKSVAQFAGGDSLLFLSADGNLVGYTMSAALKVWDVRAGKEVCALAQAPKGATRLLGAAVSADGRRLVALYDGGVKAGPVGRPAPWKGGPIKAIPIPPGPSKAPQRLEGMVKVWQLPAGKELRSLPLSFDKLGPLTKYCALAFSPKGDHVALGNYHNHHRVLVWDSRMGKELGTLQSSAVSSLNFSADGKRLVVAGYTPAVLVWELPEP